ncbi:hypothetical protein FRC06_009618 [Ceratobasidium sp. 370]|nr:hypothetical protein FRC06_009618 [Ceratobasidium sp. 370]
MARTTRASAKAAAAPASSDAPAADAPTTTASASKGKAAAKKAPASKKRTRADADDQDDADASTKPASKKKKAKNDSVKDDTNADTPMPDADKKDDASDEKDNVADKKDNAVDDKDDTTDVQNNVASTSNDAPAKAKTPEPAPKMVSVLKRGAAPVDPLSPHLVASHQVYVDSNGEIWDAMLNQTDAVNNNNKFYVLQLLHPTNNSNSVSLHVRWGRVGESGSSQDKGPWPPAQAVSEFMKQFKSKAGADWKNRKTMQPKKGKYMWLERAYGDDDDGAQSSDKGKGKDEPREKTPEPTLGAELLDLSLAEVLAEPNGAKAAEHGGQRQACIALTNAYYSVIPHAFGRRHPIIIDKPEILKRELELVDALGDMEIANKIMNDSRPKDADGKPVNPLDANLRSLDLKSIEPVQRGGKEWKAIDQYMSGTHGFTHHYRSNLRNLFRVERHGETEAWNKAGWDKLGDGERMLLWHGSRSTNFAGILKQGLRIAPPEAPVTGYMFGKGVYFADSFSKSANYCHSRQSKNIGILLLCEIAAKPCHELLNADYHADQTSKNNNAIATKGVGRTQPGEWQDCAEALGNEALKGVIMPKGELKQLDPPGAYLQYNEYIVYSPNQIRVRYLLMVEMTQ